VSGSVGGMARLVIYDSSPERDIIKNRHEIIEEYPFEAK
jgi:hypothetical protein